MSGTVLIADENTANRIIMRSMATGMFSRVWMAGTLDEVMSQLSQGLPDLIVIAADLVREGVSQLLSQVRAMAPGIPIMAVVPEGMPARIAAFDAGADDVMAQPLDQALFRARSKRLMRRTTGPAMPRAWGMAEAPALFDGLIPAALTGVTTSDRQTLIMGLRKFGIAIAANAGASRVNLYWGSGRGPAPAFQHVAANRGPVVCVLPEVSPEQEVRLLTAGAADVQSGTTDLAELRSRILRILPRPQPMLRSIARS